MNQTLGFFITLLVPMFLFAEPLFTYQPQTGKCLNPKGIEGLNQPDLSTVFVLDQAQGFHRAAKSISNKNLECADLKNIHFAEVLKTGASYVDLRNWNLKGADLSGSNVRWMVFIGGTLEGANMADSTIGYTMFRETQVDEFTTGLSDHCFETAHVQRVNCQM